MEKVLKTFTFEGKKYEVKIITDGNNIKIRAFHGGRPANELSIQIDNITMSDFNSVIGTSAIDEFAKIVEDDVLRKLSESLRKLGGKDETI